MPKRLDKQAHEWIDRDSPLSFVFEGERYDALAGDVVTSALLANDRTTLARSFKYHRPRGVLSAANHDANVLLSSGSRTNIRADVEPVQAGRCYRAVNTYGGLRFDLARCMQMFSRVLPVGFYYKAFYRPRALFPLWERLIRTMAGLGKVNTEDEAVRYTRSNRFCDVLVVGGGVAGLTAAHACIGKDLKVILVDENPHLGGSFDYLHARDDVAQRNKQQMLRELEAAPEIEIFRGYFAAGFYTDNCVPLVSSSGLVHAQAKQVIIATGLYEQPAVFRNNDVPGVMLASGAQRLVHRFAVSPGDKVVVLAGNDEAYTAAFDLAEAGVGLSAIVDLEDPTKRGKLAEQALHHGIQVVPLAMVDEALTRDGRLHEIQVRSLDGKKAQHFECDALLMSVGWAPAAGLLYQAGARLAYDGVLGQVLPQDLPQGLHTAGRINGIFDYQDQIADAVAAAVDACAQLTGASTTSVRPAIAASEHSHRYPIAAHVHGKEFVDFDEDLTIQDLKTAFREGFDSAELMKRYSTIGMGPSQGKVSNMNGVRILAELRDAEVNAIGVTTTRPFTYPVPMGVLAGRRIRRQWRTPMHADHENRNADLTEAGTWLRPMSYSPKSPRAAIEQEYALVRNSVGLIDVSTLGKIEIFGRDAQALLEYAYTCSFDKLKQGMTRYIFMVDGSGTLVDDGVAARFADDHFYITATSSHAQAVVRQLHQYVVQLGFDVAVVDRTFQVGALNLAGPRSRDVLQRLSDIDLCAEAFPYLAIREGKIAGVEARAMRVGFVGELGYEIHFPVAAGAAIWRALLDAGAPEGIAPFGVEAQRLLRLEKGHLIFGQDTDGTTNPFEANLGWGVRLSKERFVGKHSLTLLKPMLARKLVGFIGDKDAARGIAECHLVIEQGDIAGRVTSVAYSPHRDAVIGLAMIDLALCDEGHEILVRLSDGSLVTVTVCSTPFYDPDNIVQQLPSTEGVA